MNLFRTFHIGSRRILEKGCSASGVVTMVQKSCLYVIKKPVRLYLNDSNTLYSHFITFDYQVEGVSYRGKLFISPNYRCPQKGERIEVFYDPADPKQYACYAFGPAAYPPGW